MPVVPVAPPAPGSPPPVPQPGTFQTEQEKLDASLPKFLEAANAYPNPDGRHRGAVPCGGDSGGAGQTRRGRAALPGSGGQGRNHDLRAHRAPGDGRIADRAREVRHAITIYSELSRDTTSTLPLDSVLMHLGRAYARAGKKEEATHRSSAWSTSSRSRPMPPMRGARWKKPKKRVRRRRRGATTRRAFRGVGDRPVGPAASVRPGAAGAYSVGAPVRWTGFADPEHRRQHVRARAAPAAGQCGSRADLSTWKYTIR